MSYILDALRRADAERQRGQVPGLGAQPAAAAADTDAPRRLPGWVIAAGILAAAAGLVALVMWRTQPIAAPAAALPAPAASAPALPPLASPPPPLPIVVSAPPQPAQPAPVVVPLSAPAAPAAPAAAASRPAAPPTPLAALSADQRRELPPLVLGGSIWSDNAAQRFVIVNGQVVHEGEAAASGVIVERITPRSAILRWRELRIELPL